MVYSYKIALVKEGEMKVTKHRIYWTVEGVGTFGLAWAITGFVIYLLGKGLDSVPSTSGQIVLLVLMAVGALGILFLTIAYLLPNNRSNYTSASKLNYLEALASAVIIGLFAPLIFTVEYILPLFKKTRPS